MDRIEQPHLGVSVGPLRIRPMANPPAADALRLRAAAAADSIEFSTAARRVTEGADARPSRARALVGARVAGPAPFVQAEAAPRPEQGAPLPFYRDPALANVAATSIAGAQLDIIA